MGKSHIVSKALMSAEAVAQADTHYTSSIHTANSAGDAGIYLISTAGTVTITQQCSFDDSTWYNPVDSAGSTTGTVCTAKAVTTGTWISYSPVMAPYTRFKVVETNTAPTAVSITFSFRAEY